MGDESKKKNHEKVVETARKRFSLMVSADSENRELALDDIKFRSGDQWPDHIKNQRSLENRPCLTINRIPQHVHQITNDQRQNRPAIKISPFDDNADIETAEIMQGLIRSIESNSDADTAYDIGFDNAVACGRGFFRILTEYSDSKSFNQDIKLEPVYIYGGAGLDPSYKKPDGSDANWGFVFETISKDDFKAQYPKAEANDSTFDWKAEEDDWFDEDHVRIAEYFVKEYKEETLYLLPDNSTMLQSEIDELNEEERFTFELLLEEQGISLDNLKTRQTFVPKVMWYKMCGNEILEETEWPSKWIPIIPIHGEVLWNDGKRVFEGIIRHAKDPQRMYNYWATCETEAIALAPKAPFVGVEGQFSGHENKWKNAHLKNYPYLEYKPVSLGGQLAPAPQRQFGEPNVQAISNARMFASDDLKSSTGHYDSALGNSSNEVSGKAINSRVRQSQTGNFHFIDNLSKSIKHAGRIIVDMLPRIYDSERVVRILGEDDKQKIVKINKMFTDENGKEKFYDFSVGKYDVTVSVGPSYATKRQEAVESMLDLSRSYPRLPEVAGDIMIGAMDFPMAQDISKRVKKTISPEILNDEDTRIPPGAKAQLDQLGQMVEQLTNQLNSAQDKLDNKTIELESKERIEMAKINAQLEMKHAELEAKESATPQELEILAKGIIELSERMDLLNFQVPINQDEIAENLEQEIAQKNNLPGEMSPAQTDLPVDGVPNE